MKICVISSCNKPYPAFNNTVRILGAIYSQEKVIVLRAKLRTPKVPKFAKQISYLLDELIFSIKLLRVLHETEHILIFQEYHLLLTLLARLSRKKLIQFVGGSATLGSFYREEANDSLFSKIIFASNVLLAGFCNSLSQRVISNTPQLSNSIESSKIKAKIDLASVFLKESLFDVKEEYGDRKQVIGFVGNLERIKGVMNLVDAIPHILKKLNEMNAIIIGEGSLSDTIKLKLKRYNIIDSVKLIGLVAHSELPRYYNDFKLLVLPSYSEGIPSVILEAMACGTPVLATPVGGVPDIIKNSETGFILESNEPEHIANRITDLFNQPKLLECVSENAHRWVNESFSEEKTIDTWRKILMQSKIAE